MESLGTYSLQSTEIKPLKLIIFFFMFVFVSITGIWLYQVIDTTIFIEDELQHSDRLDVHNIEVKKRITIGDEQYLVYYGTYFSYLDDEELSTYVLVKVTSRHFIKHYQTLSKTRTSYYQEGDSYIYIPRSLGADIEFYDDQTRLILFGERGDCSKAFIYTIDDEVITVDLPTDKFLIHEVTFNERLLIKDIKYE